ncbi:hypothetical protein [Crocinitomix catalasitica]|uniref:hypothetical protein n=1 Tax=Crocinitomix catalasitica TaxID=184607 RepID=UPI00048595F6|nr:hypothetical protein [Crocinitomix catalasitica]
MIGYYGLKSIYKSEVKKNIFHILITSFAVNHIIHLFFVSQFFKDQVMELSILENLHGFITFIFLIGLPILLLAYDKLNKLIYSLIILNLINVTYFISITFYSRVKPADDAYLHQVGILIMIIAVLYMLFRVFKENRSVNNS